MSIGTITSGIVELLTTFIVVWCLLSWFPNIRWHEQPFKTLDRIVQPLVSPFRRLIPPVSGIDFSPVIAILVLQMFSNFLRSILP